LGLDFEFNLPNSDEGAGFFLYFLMIMMMIARYCSLCHACPLCLAPFHVGIALESFYYPDDGLAWLDIENQSLLFLSHCFCFNNLRLLSCTCAATLLLQHEGCSDLGSPFAST